MDSLPESLADSGYESSWPSLLEAAACPSTQQQRHHHNQQHRRRGSLTSAELDLSVDFEHPTMTMKNGLAGYSPDSGGLLLQHNRGQHSYVRQSKSTSWADEGTKKKAGSGQRHRLAKSQRKRARTQAYQAKRLAQFQNTMMPLVDIGSPHMEEDEDHCLDEVEPPIPLSVMPYRWLFEEDHSSSFIDDALVAVPKREWVYDSSGTMSMDAKSFGVMSWNLLSPKLCHPVRLDIGCKPDHLEWNIRKQSILNQIAFTDSDFICLQELELKDYEEYFAPRLARLGYRSIHAYKMNVYEMRDGCAIFYRESRFRLLDEHVLRFNQVELDDNNNKRPSMARDTAIRFNLFHNLALVALFENKRTRRCVQLATTHLLADPAFPDAKMLQTAILTSKLEELKAAAMAAQSQRTTSHNQHQHHIPTILAGDFNSLPDSSVVNYLKTGKVETRHFGDNDFGRFTRSDTKHFHHRLGLCDSYKSSTLPFTNSTRHFQGTIDYLLYDPTSLGLVGFMDHLAMESEQTPVNNQRAVERKESMDQVSKFSELFHNLNVSGKGRADDRRASTSRSTRTSSSSSCRSSRGSNSSIGLSDSDATDIPSSRPQLPKALPCEHFPSDHIPLAAIFREHDYSVQHQQYLH
ncbi:Glucose-repressible alcohol dehydrogenase transcriptional effector [Podila epigama]|nr:Glucose-repressible alcohol dehydrogenase transcriptional effector [Podila epigama]